MLPLRAYAYTDIHMRELIDATTRFSAAAFSFHLTLKPLTPRIIIFIAGLLEMMLEHVFFEHPFPSI